MGRKRIAATQAETAAQETSADAPQESASSKAEAVRILLGEGVSDADDAIPAIKDRFGMDISRQQFSTYKSIEKNKGKSKGRRGGRPRKDAAKLAAAPVAAKSASSQGDMVDDLAVVKRLVGRLGGPQVRKIVELFE
jgi:hypothetical protein